MKRLAVLVRRDSPPLVVPDPKAPWGYPPPPVRVAGNCDPGHASLPHSGGTTLLQDHPASTRARIARNESEAGTATSELVRRHGISRNTFYNWRKKCGCLDVNEARRLAVDGFAADNKVAEEQSAQFGDLRGD